MHHAEEADGDDERAERVLAYRALERADLEAQAIECIRKLRLFVATAQVLYDEWVRAEEDVASPATVIGAMQADYVQRQRELADMQEGLNEMLEALGYIPEIPG